MRVCCLCVCCLCVCAVCVCVGCACVLFVCVVRVCVCVCPCICVVSVSVCYASRWLFACVSHCRRSKPKLLSFSICNAPTKVEVSLWQPVFFGTRPFRPFPFCVWRIPWAGLIAHAIRSRPAPGWVLLPQVPAGSAQAAQAPETVRIPPPIGEGYELILLNVCWQPWKSFRGPNSKQLVCRIVRGFGVVKCYFPASLGVG